MGDTLFDDDWRRDSAEAIEDADREKDKPRTSKERTMRLRLEEDK